MQKDAIDAIVGRYVHKNKRGVRGFWKGDRKLKWMEQNGRSLHWPIAVSGDGRLVVGRGKIQGKSLACVWRPDTGNVRSVQELATQAGIDTKGWKLLEAVAVSEDGKVMAGNGTNPAGQSEAWILNLRSGSSLTAR